MDIPGYWQTVTVPGYYETVWIPPTTKQEWVCHKEPDYTIDNYTGYGGDYKYNSAVGDKKVGEVVWGSKTLDPNPIGGGIHPPADYNFIIQGVKKFCYIKCSIYDKYFKQQ